MMSKINKLNFESKDVVKTLLNIIKKDEQDTRCCYQMQFGFFDNETDLNEFKNNLDTENLQMLLEGNFKFNNWSPKDNNLINEYVWIKYDYLEIWSFKDVKTLIEEMNDLSSDYYAEEVFKKYEGTINNLLKLSLNY